MIKLKLILTAPEILEFINIFHNNIHKFDNKDSMIKNFQLNFSGTPFESSQEIKSKSFQVANEIIITLGSAGAIAAFCKVIAAYLKYRKTIITLKHGERVIKLEGPVSDIKEITNSVNSLIHELETSNVTKTS